MAAKEQLKNIWTAAGERALHCELLDSGVDPNIQDDFGYTPIAAAVSYNFLSIVNLLLSRGAYVNIVDIEGDTPLFVAETVEAVQLLLEYGADPKHINYEGRTAASVAYEEGWYEVAALLREVTGEAEPEDVDEEDGDYSFPEVESSDNPEFAEKFDRLMRASEEDGINRDDELRGLVAGLALGEFGRGVPMGKEGPGDGSM
ncbi:ankyrin repeat-containing domain protein [Jimgerdemannia flammicorona]|uniref:Ankyrin repeat-containing domain protein n=1 Tax=Jimgerdemannia flammicorona TaxID=994334 RepID=A0A433Q1I8_9FUNG|nr:ankyrin repeat-containing domain protein [Jimgerdemannia flammicorona]